jgi:hypothetical protein
MDFEQLQNLLSDWYEVPSSDLGIPESDIRTLSNPILKDFYRRFGALAQRKSQFAHPESRNSPLSCQDHIFPIDELKTENGFTVFCDENQSVFVVAASDVSSDSETYARGDGVSDHFIRELTGVRVPLQECLITCVLRETIMSVGDRYRRITPENLKMALQLAQAGETVRSRYIWSDSYYSFHLSKDVWFMNWGGMQFAAHRGMWRQKPSTWQEQVFENGGSWSSGPSEPTVKQNIERFLTGLRK